MEDTGNIFDKDEEAPEVSKEPQEQNASEAKDYDNHEDLIGSIPSDVAGLPEIHLINHFSIGKPCSTVRFRNKRVVVYNIYNDDQIILEEALSSGEPQRQEITVKRLSTGTTGLRFLRSMYCLVILLILGFLVAFCFQIILFLFLNMAGSGNVEKITRAHLAAVIASVPLHLYAMASIIAMGTTALKDTWKGNPLFQKLIGFSNDTLMEAICVVSFLIIPGFTAASTLLAKQDDWWDTTAITFVVCILSFMAVFSLLVVVNEVRTALWLMKLDHPDASLMNRVREAVLMGQRMFYSGIKRHYLLQKGNGERQILKTKISPYSRITLFNCCNLFFRKLDPPVRMYSSEEVRDVLPFYTTQNWSMERMFCRNPNKAAVFVQTGPDAVREHQIKASMIFSIIGALLIVVFVAGVLVWYRSPASVVTVISLFVFVFWILPVNLSTARLYRIFNQSAKSDFAKNDDKNDEGALFQVWERNRISEPTEVLCWILLTLCIVAGFVWPFISFLVNEEYTTATFFFILGFFSLPRLYLNPVPLLRSKGPLSKITLSGRIATNQSLTSLDNAVLTLSQKERAEVEDSNIIQKAKLAKLVGEVNNRGTVRGWMSFFGSLMILVGAFSLAAYQEAVEGFDYKVKVPEDEPFFAENFYYPPQPKLPYPTCTIAKHFSLLEAEQDSQLLDIAYLAVTSFSAPDESKRLLRMWFGEDQVIDKYEFVNDWRVSTDRTAGVSFKLFSFPNNPGVGVVSIRGSESLLDWVVDVQIWLGAALAQYVRALIPLGWIWTGILDELVYLVNTVESDNLKKVAYYRTTTKFVEDVLAGENVPLKYSELRVTGASLGGGLAIITGAQTNTTTVAISGLNAMITRRTLIPPVTEAALNTHVFNWIPDRDPVAHVDDPGRLLQFAECRAPKHSFFGCHSMWRSICEIMYQCGSQNRPALCWCNRKYGYPEPLPNGTETFVEVCPPTD